MIDTYKSLKNFQPVIEYSNTWNFRHATKDIIGILKKHGCKSVLEVCCGTGKLLQEIRKNDIKCMGIDCSKTMLDRAARKKRAPAENLLLQDAVEMDFAEDFDAVITQIALHEMNPEVRNKVFENMKKAVRKGGILIISDFAVTNNKSLNARINGYFLRKGEEYFLGCFPEHYANYLEFMNNGGIAGFLKDEKLISYNVYLGGHIGVACVQK